MIKKTRKGFQKNQYLRLQIAWYSLLSAAERRGTPVFLCREERYPCTLCVGFR